MTTNIRMACILALTILLPIVMPTIGSAQQCGLSLPCNQTVSSSSPAVSLSNTQGVGIQSKGSIGLWGQSDSRAIVGTQGQTSCAGNYAIGGCAVAGIGVFGRGEERAIVGTQGETSCAGVYAVGGCATSGDGILGRSIGGRAGRFAGNVVIEGNLTLVGNLVKGSGSFAIDHPLDPERRYLHHSLVESSEMMNIYNGTVVLDDKGEGWVELPEWFEALNGDFRYQLTAVGAPGPQLHIAARISNNRFRIGGGSPSLEVSWQVTGVRRDAYAKANRIPVETLKPEGERGRYLHPEPHGHSSNERVDFTSPTQIERPLKR